VPWDTYRRRGLRSKVPARLLDISSTAETDYPGTLPATWLAERLAVDPARIDAMRRAGELIAVRAPGSTEWRYPAWQFDSGAPRPSVPRVVATAREAGLDEARLYELLTTPLGLRAGGKRLSDLLLEGRDDEVVSAIRAAS
jgi:hypothetical protein